MGLKDDLKPTGKKGVFFKEHPTRKHGVKKDRQLVLRYTLGGTTYLEVFGWTSEGKTDLLAELKIAEFRANHRSGSGPISLAEERELAERERREREAAEALAAERNRKFTDLAEEYLSGLTLRKKTLRQYQDGLALAAQHKPGKGVPKIGDTLISQVTKRVLAQCIESIAKKSPSTAVSVRSSLSAFYSWLAEPSREYIDANFIPAIPKPKANAPRDRTLTDKEIVVLWRGLDQHGDHPMARLFKFLFLTGVRLAEAKNMRLDEVDGSWWTIPASRTKGKRPHRVYLTETAKNLIGERPIPFASTRPKKDGDSIQDRPFADSSTRKFLRKEDHQDPVTGEQYKREPFFGLEPFSPHDARRTVASGLALLGIPSDTVAAVLAHRLPGVTAMHYLRHDQDAEKERALRAWEAHVLRITGAQDSEKVVQLHRKQP